jgi:hypothetical protein
MKVPPERWPAMLNGAKLVPIADTRPHPATRAGV